MSGIGFQARQRFDASHGDRWVKYVESAGLELKEVVGLDCSLCPNLVDELTAEDWEHLVPDEGLSGVFDTTDYLRSRCPGIAEGQLLAVLKDPGVDAEALVPEQGFAFKGFELIEEATEISALTNCGGFHRAFASTDLNSCGLISTHRRAREVQAALWENYPDECHADCELWAVWRCEA